MVSSIEVVHVLSLCHVLLSGGGGHGVVSFLDPVFKLDKGLVHFARNLGLADSALPEIWRTNQIPYTC